MRKSIILFSLFTTILFLLVACQGSIYSKTAGMAFYPEASASSEACYCTAIYDPVCGVDGITYSNTCQAGCAGVTVAYEGECTVNEKLCPYGCSNSVTYSLSSTNIKHIFFDGRVPDISIERVWSTGASIFIPGRRITLQTGQCMVSSYEWTYCLDAVNLATGMATLTIGKCQAGECTSTVTYPRTAPATPLLVRDVKNMRLISATPEGMPVFVATAAIHAPGAAINSMSPRDYGSMQLPGSYHYKNYPSSSDTGLAIGFQKLPSFPVQQLTFELTVLQGSTEKKINVYFPNEIFMRYTTLLDWEALVLYVGEDGSTYYDPELTMLARSAPVCGNGIVEPGEQCDVGRYGDQWCSSLCEGVDLQITKVGCANLHVYDGTSLESPAKLWPVVWGKNFGLKRISSQYAIGVFNGGMVGDTPTHITTYFGHGQADFGGMGGLQEGAAVLVPLVTPVPTVGDTAYFNLKTDWRLHSGASQEVVSEYNEQNNEVKGIQLNIGDCKPIGEINTHLNDPSYWTVYTCSNGICARI